MRVIKPSVAIWEHADGVAETMKHIERCGRVCYKSEAKIAEGSAEKFVGGLIRRGHEAVLEHGTLIAAASEAVYNDIHYFAENMSSRKQPCYLRFTKTHNGKNIISGNVRAWRDFVKYLLESSPILPGYFYDFMAKNHVFFPEVSLDRAFYWGNIEDKSLVQISENDLCSGIETLVHKRITVDFICDRGVTHEIVRHRPASYCQESTRYCNYAKDDFGNQISVIKPFWLRPGSKEYDIWAKTCQAAEDGYFQMLENGSTPQEARAVLPNSLKADLVMTANVEEWKHFLELRNSKFAHPQMEEVAAMLDRAFKEKYPGIF